MENLYGALKSGVKHTPLFPLLRRRRLHAYVLGPPKTGTTSLSEIFRPRFRAEHEPLSVRTRDYVRFAHEQKRPMDELIRYLRWRDRELYLDVEASHPMTVFADLLARTFPDARFIVSFREPLSWLGSIINMRLNKAVHRFDPTPRILRRHSFNISTIAISDEG